MKLEEFLDNDVEIHEPTGEEMRGLRNKAWRAQIERVLGAYIGECEFYRREVRELRTQVSALEKKLFVLK